jgi:hypothetical protein
MTVWVAINCGEFGAIYDMQVFYSHGAAKGYVRRQKNKDSYSIEQRKVQE